MNERDLFNAALSAQDNAARRAYLEAACAGDEALRLRVETLLKAHDGADHFLERPAFPDVAAESGRTDGPSEPIVGTGRVAFAITESCDPARIRTTTTPDDDPLPLDFLQPSDKPGSLGRLAHYEVLEVLGQGGFGTVVKAFDEKLHRMVAIKVMARSLAATSPPRKRFLREARASAAIRHENVVSIYAVDEQPSPYLVMEYIAGQTLQQKLDRVGPIEILEVLRIGVQVANGLVAAHSQGLIHRDIKPANILLEAGAESVKLTDFGLARTADDASLTQSGVIAGTPLYMAPEQALGTTIDQRADLFSLGSVLYVMCTGRPPFRASTTLAVLKRVVEDTPRPIREIVPEVPEWLCAIINRLHAKDPADRFATAQEVADLLKGHLDALLSPWDVHPNLVLPPPTSQPSRALIDSGLTAIAQSSKKGHSSSEIVLPQGWRRSRAVLVAASAALLAVLGLAETNGVTHLSAVLERLLSTEGTLIVAVDDPGVNITVANDEDLAIYRGDGATQMRLKAGQYRLSARLENKELTSLFFTITRNQTHAVHVNQQMLIGHPVSPTPAQSFGSWGRLIDPRGGCRVSQEGERLKITIPGDSPRDLNPNPEFNLDSPRLVQPVDADFTIQVTVPPFPRPSPFTTYKNGAGSYHGAGLVIWADDRNFLRFVRAGLAQTGGGAPYTHLEFFRDGRKTGEELHWTAEGATHLQAERRGDSLSLRTSSDGLTWIDIKNYPVAGLPLKLLVGVAAMNSEAKDFAPEFEGWRLKVSGPGTRQPGPTGPSSLIAPKAIDRLGSRGSAEAAFSLSNIHFDYP